jgi:hypothetical protein
MTRILLWPVVATALPLGGCYAEVSPAPYYAPAPAPPVVYGRTYVWHNYGHERR